MIKSSNIETSWYQPVTLEQQTNREFDSNTCWVNILAKFLLMFIEESRHGRKIGEIFHYD